MLRNAAGGVRGVSNVSGKKALRRCTYGSTLLALRGGWVGVQIPGKKR